MLLHGTHQPCCKGYTAGERLHGEALVDETSGNERKDMSRKTKTFQKDTLLNVAM